MDDFTHYYTDVLKKYAVFSGRVRRKEYWMFTLVSAIVSFLISFAGSLIFGHHSDNILPELYGLAVLVPSLAVLARRLHDTGRSGWWMLIGIIPIIGWIILLLFAIQDSEAGTNEYGPNPKGITTGSSATPTSPTPSPSSEPQIPPTNDQSTPTI